MKKIICIILLISFIFVKNCYATFDYDYEAIPTWSDTIEVMAQIQNKVDLNLESEAAILMDEETGTILYTKCYQSNDLTFNNGSHRQWGYFVRR